MKSFVVIGMGRFGMNLAKSLGELGYDVMAIDKDPELIQEISPFVTHAVVANASDEIALKSLGIRNFDMAIIAIGEDIQASILATVITKELGLKNVLVKANSEIHEKILKKVGADKVIFPEKEMAQRVAHSVAQSNILDYITLSSDYSIIEIVVPKIWDGKDLKKLNLRAGYGINVMAIKQDDIINISPNADNVVNEGDILVVIGSNKDLDILQTMVD